MKKRTLPYEIFNYELNYYFVLFVKSILKARLGVVFPSEKTKFINLLEQYSMSIKNNAFQEFKNEKQREYKGRSFNQPISYDSKELIHYNCYISIYLVILENKNKESLKNEEYIIEEILKQKIIEQIEPAEVLIPLTVFIINSEPKKKVNSL